jgi:hypothetical protein
MLSLCHPELAEGLLGISAKDDQGFDKLSLTVFIFEF